MPTSTQAPARPTRAIPRTNGVGASPSTSHIGEGRVPGGDCDEVITLPAAARLLGVGPTTLKRWSDQGRLPHTRTPGGHRRFLRSVVLDFRALVDPRASASALAGHLSLRLGHPSEWVDRAHTLADPDRLEAALLALRAGCPSWGVAADTVLTQFVMGLRLRHLEGRLSEGAWRALQRSFVRSVQRAAGRLRPGVGSPVALLATPAGATGPMLIALAETVLRECGYTVLDVGRLDDVGVLEEVIAEQRPHQVLLLADDHAQAGVLVSRLGGVSRAAARHGAEIWLMGGANWPMLDGARRIPSFAALAGTARRRLAPAEGVRASS